jgi:hypothetical protein
MIHAAPRLRGVLALSLILNVAACKGSPKPSVQGLTLVASALEATENEAHEVLQKGFVQVMEEEKLGHPACVEGVRVQLEASPDEVHRLSHRAFTDCAPFPCSFKVDGPELFCAKESKPDWLKPLLPAREVLSPDFAVTWMILAWIKDNLSENQALWQRYKAQLPKLNRDILSERDAWNGS